MGTRGLYSVGFVAMALGLSAVACSSDNDTANVDNSPVGLVADAPARSVDELRLNELQYIGTHNSYHVAPTPELFEAEKAALSLLGDDANALGNIDSLLYTHDPLSVQLDSGIRAFELDVFADPEGGLFANPMGPTILGVDGGEIAAEMSEPGFKVVHIQDVDFRSTCPTLVVCLGEIKTWSSANPDHLPIIIQIEAKDDMLPAPIDITETVPVDATQLAALDAEIRSVFDDDQLITPDDVRGEAATLRDAVTAHGWPTIGDSRGKVMFFLDNGGAVHEAYLEGAPSLEGRVLFTSESADDAADRAFVKYNTSTDERIADAVRSGFIVRTRSDSNLEESWANNTAPRDAALASGAQIVSTDFPGSKPADNGYVVTFGTPVEVRCNLVVVTTCPTGALEG